MVQNSTSSHFVALSFSAFLKTYLCVSALKFPWMRFFASVVAAFLHLFPVISLYLVPGFAESATPSTAQNVSKDVKYPQELQKIIRVLIGKRLDNDDQPLDLKYIFNIDWKMMIIQFLFKFTSISREMDIHLRHINR